MTNDKYGILLGIMVVAVIKVLSLVVLPVVFSISFDDNGQSIITATQPHHTWINETVEELK